MLERPPLEHSAQLELLKSATDSFGRSASLLLPAVGVLCVAAWQSGLQLSVAVVGGLAAIIGLWRVRIARRVSASSAADASFVRRAIRETEANTALTAAMWVISTIWIYPGLDFSGRSFYATLMCGSIGTAAFFMPLIGRSFEILTIAQMTALTGMSFFHLETRSLPVACMAMLYGATMVAGGRKFSAVMANSIQNRLQVDQVNDSLVRARDAAEAANRAKSAFLANMSHEIRTPLTSVIGFAEELLDLDRTMKQRIEATQTIHRTGKHLLHIVNAILDLSKIEAGQLDIERTTVPLLELIEEVSALARLRAADKGLSFELETVFPLPSTVHVDLLRLRQILLNLVTNAFKFTHAGTVTLGCRYDMATEQLQFSVSDTGIGITAAQVERLFQPFGQADTSISRRFGGTGLGLTLSRSFAERLGGTLKLDSSSPNGSCFILTLPVGPVGELLQSEPLAPQLLRDLSHEADDPDVALIGKVLLAEDNPDNQRLVTRCLQRLGVTVEVVSNGSEAVAAALAEPRHLILMDMQMPILDGPSAIRTLRAQGYEGVIVALTANATREDLQTCSEAGADGFLTKPIDIAQFEKTVRCFLPSGAPEVDSVPVEAPLFAETAPDTAVRAKALARLLHALPLLRDETHAARSLADFARVGDLAHQLSDLARDVRCPPAAQLGGQLQFAAAAGNLLAVQRLLVRLDKLIAQCRHEAQRHETPSSVASDDNSAIVSEMLAEGPEMIELVSYFLEKLPGYQSRMRDAALARDLNGVGQCAHNLKSVGGGYGYPSLFALAKDFEAAVVTQNESAVMRLVQDFDALAVRIFRGAPRPIGEAATAAAI